MTRHSLFTLLCSLILLLLASCSASRHVPEGKYLLDKVSLNINKDSATVTSDEMSVYLRQTPNHKILWSAKLQLGIYNMSGKDSTKWWNCWIRRLGEAPVVYDSTLTEMSRNQLRNALINKGYLHASVDVDTTFDTRKRKAKVEYNLHPGEVYMINEIDYKFPNDTIRDLVMAQESRFRVRRGDKLNHVFLDNQRDLVSSLLRSHGYYGFSKEFITFNADTTGGSRMVDLTMIVNPPYKHAASTPKTMVIPSHTPYVINNVRCITNYDPVEMSDISAIAARDTVDYKGLQIFYAHSHYLRAPVIYENCFIHKGDLFDERNVRRTYEAMSRLSILKFIDIRFEYAGRIGDVDLLDCYILLTRDKSQSISLELEGTNSEGDLGVAAGLTYTHRNIGHGSESFNAKGRLAYESLSGNFDGLLHNRYLETSLETSLQFPKFMFPFLRSNFKRSIKASTLFNMAFNYQERPEYTRLIAAGSWAYQWSERISGNRHRFTPIDINYVYLPESTNDFINQIAPDNPLLRYSYEDHFIMSMGYNFYRTNKRNATPWDRGVQKNIYTVRAAGEVAGNLLLALSCIFNHRHDFRDNPYKIFGIRYSQYFKLEGDYSFIHNFDHRNALAIHAGLGVAYPYGNSTILPFEKRFYGGGASGVRGWDVRTLGPGSFRSTNSVTDFIYQCGDIRLIMSAEYRAKLFWVVELGLFVDAGNIWTIKNYDTQPGGLFRFKDFYKQLAMAYGIGLRLDFNYFLLRFDMGMKAHNPAEGAEPWPLIHPRWGRDRSFHFSIGYPF